MGVVLCCVCVYAVTLDGGGGERKEEREGMKVCVCGAPVVRCDVVVDWANVSSVCSCCLLLFDDEEDDDYAVCCRDRFVVLFGFQNESARQTDVCCRDNFSRFFDEHSSFSPLLSLLCSSLQTCLCLLCEDSKESSGVVVVCWCVCFVCSCPSERRVCFVRRAC